MSRASIRTVVPIQPPATKRRLTRAEKTEGTRRALYQAASKVVGEHGYAGASISRITSLANVAQGTFYNYFKSRQDLFDKLLPTLGADLLDYIEARVDPALSGAEKEECRLRAWFAYQDENPEFLRILNEAEIFAPRAYWAHIDNIANGYLRSMKRARARGEIAALDDEALHAIATILLAARTYLGQGRTRHLGSRDAPVPESVIRGYMALVRGGLFTRACGQGLGHRRTQKT